MVYIMTRGQVATAGMGEVVDISIPAIKIVMDLRRVTDQLGCLTRVRRLFHDVRAERQNK